MRIGFVSQWYPPEVPGVIPPAMAHSLAARGHEVHVVTGFPNYPHGTLYPGYSVQSYQQERDGDVTVHRGPLYPSHDRSALRRAANYLSFSAGGTWAAKQVPRPDVWLTNGTPVTAAVPALTMAAAHGTPHAIVVQDLWPDSVTESGFTSPRVGRLLDAVLGPVSTGIYRRADAVGVISPGMRELLADRGVDADGIHYTPNAVSDRHLHPGPVDRAALRRELGLPTTGLLFMYAGNLGELQNLENLVRAFQAQPSAQLALVGRGVAEDRLRRLAADHPNIHLMGHQPTERIGRYLAASDIQVVSLVDSPLLRVTMPSKVQTSLAAARPVFAHAAGDAASVITELGAGLAADPSDPRSAQATIAEFLATSPDALDMMGAAGRAEYERTYTPASAGERLEALLNTALERKHRD